MGWNSEGITNVKCHKCGARMTLMSGSWSEQPPDAFGLFCSKCNYFKEIDDNYGYKLLFQIGRKKRHIMKDIGLFKAKRKGNNSWVKGYYIKLNNTHYILPENKKIEKLGIESKDLIEIKPETLKTSRRDEIIINNKILRETMVKMGIKNYNELADKLNIDRLLLLSVIKYKRFWSETIISRVEQLLRLPRIEWAFGNYITTDKNEVKSVYDRVNYYMKVHYHKDLNKLKLTYIAGYWKDEDGNVYVYIDGGRQRYRSWRILQESQQQKL